MAPILIDGRGLFKLGFSAVIITALIFFGGFFAGYQKASAFYQYASDAQPLMLPDVTGNTGAERDARVPQVALAGEDIDVDQPEVLSSAGGLEKPLAHDDIHAHAATSDKAMPERKTSADHNKVYVDKENASKQHASKPHASKQQDDLKHDDIRHELDITASIVSTAEASTDVYGLTAEELEKAKYSIQVGMYGSIINAENMMKMLQAQKLNAYLSEYKNKKDEIRYNVRFGLFQNKGLAVEKLDQYNSLGRGDGYLVRFSVNNLVDLADAGISTDSVAPVPAPVIEPEIDPMTERSQKLSQADLIIPGSAATN